MKLLLNMLSLSVAAILQFAFLSTSQAQTYGILSKSISPSGSIGEAKKIAIDASGNIYQTGTFGSTINFGGYTLTPASNSFSDVYIVKYNNLGVVQWAKRCGGTGSDVPKGIAVFNGKIYLVGDFAGTANFNTPNAGGTNQIVSAGGSDVFIAKFDDQGNFLWAKRCGGSSSGGDLAGQLSLLGESIYFTGSFEASANFNTPSSNSNNTISSSGSTDRNAFIAKFDTSGNFIWAAQAGGNGDDEGLGLVAIDTSIYFTGITTNQILQFKNISNSVNITINGNPGRSSFVAKYNSSGTAVWAKRDIGGISIKAAKSLCVIDTSVFICGRFEDSIQFNNPSNGLNDKLYSAGGYDMFIAKYNTTGTFLWAKRGGSKKLSTEDALAIFALDSSIYVGGYFHDTANFNTPSAFGTNEIYESIGGLSSNPDGFLAKYNDKGDIKWLKRIGGTGGDFINDLVVNQNSLYFTGGFGSIANFNTPINSGNDTLSTVAIRESYLAELKLNASPLGVSLFSFEGKGTQDGNLLKWITFQELNNAYFQVERSSDAENFTAIGTVHTKALMGHSSQKLQYEFVDHKPIEAKNYYRLKQTDQDGSFSYSNVISLFSAAENEIRLYPNPAKDQIRVMSNENFHSYQLEDIHGRLVQRGDLEYNQVILLPHLLPGIYLIRVGDKVLKFEKE